MLINKVLFLILCSVTSTHQFLKFKRHAKSVNIPLKAPHLLSDAQDIRRPLHDISPPQKTDTTNQISSPHLCNGTYLKTNGTTCGLKEIMIGRCLEYQYIRHQMFLTNNTNVRNCTELYGIFEAAVKYTAFCDWNMTTYQEFFRQALSGVHVIDRAMFWSGTYGVTHAYGGSGYNYVTLEDTLAAYMVNGLTWCGNTNGSEGFNYEFCPYKCSHNYWADLAFWGLASKSFATLTSGEIYVILNGTRERAFRNDSFFGLFELPNLPRTGKYQVEKVNVLVLHAPDLPVIEKCGEHSLIELEQLVKKAGFDYSCQDDPDELVLIMCGDDWNARECFTARKVLQYQWRHKLYGTTNSSSSMQLKITTVSIFLIFILQRIFLSISYCF